MEVKRKLPENFEQAHLCYFEPNLLVTLPEPGFKWLKKKVLLLSNGMVINGLSIEKESLLYNTRIKDIGGFITLVKFIIQSIYKKKIKIVGNHAAYVTIINEWSNNYFHWFTEAIPKLNCLLYRDAKPTILLPAIYKSSYQIRSLEIMGFPVKFFSDNVLVCNNMFLPFRLAPSSAQYNPEVMKHIAFKLKAGVNLDLYKGRRIYVSRERANIRKIINELDVIKLMQEFDFEVLNFEDYNLDEQISIMHHAEILVSVHGAGLTNMIFCNPHASVLEISLKNQTMDKCYFNLANAMDLKYYYQFCETNNDALPYISADLIVSIKDLKYNLNLMIKNAASQICVISDKKSV